MSDYATSDYATLAAGLTPRTPPLTPQSVFDTELSRQIQSADLFGGKTGSFVDCTRAGLLLWNDDLDGAHVLVQDDPCATASFWHAIIHRREGDFSNARYWWHRTGAHPAFDEIYAVILHGVADFPFIDELRMTGQWEPVVFTDFCQKAARSGQWQENLQAVQRLEMKILLEWGAARV